MSNQFVKEQENANVEQRKFFANKKANIALMILGGVIVVGIAALAIWAYI